MLDLAIKSLTSIKKVLTILHKYGHSIGYHIAKKLKTELTFSAHQNPKTIAAGIRPVPGRICDWSGDWIGKSLDEQSAALFSFPLTYTISYLYFSILNLHLNSRELGSFTLCSHTNAL